MYIPYSTQWINKEDIAAVIEALNSECLTQGPYLKQFEDKIAEYCGAKYAVAVNSGTSALHAACFAAKIGRDDEVISSPITFAASTNCVLHCGAKPIFADILQDTICIDPTEVKKAVNSKTKAIIPVHFAGHPCDLREISAIAKKNKMVVIEDAAHALGAEYYGEKIGSCLYSDMTIFSFHAIKHITTGEGGMILTNNAEYYEKLLMFRNHGITRSADRFKDNKHGSWHYEMQYLGLNYRLTDFQAALGIRQMNRLSNFLARRRGIAEKYSHAFKNNDLMVIPIEKDNVKSSWHIYPVRVRGDRGKIFNALRKEGLGVNVHYIPVYWHPYYKELGYQKGLCPKAEDYYERAVTLPLYPKMTDRQVNYVIKRVSEEVTASE